MTAKKNDRAKNTKIGRDRDEKTKNGCFALRLICIVLAAAAVLTAVYFALNIGMGDEYVVDVGAISKQSVMTGGTLEE